MVKFGKKFFFNEDEEKKQTPKRSDKKKVVKKRDGKLALEKIKYYSRKIIPFILILVLALGLLFLVKSCSKSSKKSKSGSSNEGEVEKVEPKILDTIRIKINEEIPTIDKFVRNYSKVKTDKDQIIYDETNLSNNTYTQVGEYKLTIKIGEKEYRARIVVRDEDAPVFNLKNVTINEGSAYSIADFIENCVDNSNKACTFEYVDQAYGKYTSAGTYEIKIVASDTSGNKAEAKAATLTIVQKQTPTPKPNPKPTPTCSYGKDTVKSGEIVSYYVSSNGCAVNIDYAKTSKYLDTPKTIAANDKKQLEDQMRSKNYQGSVKFDLSITPVINSTGNGLVGYKIVWKAIETSNNSVIAHYTIKSNGTRAYQVNTLNLP